MAVRRLAVLESEWWHTHSQSVRPMLDSVVQTLSDHEQQNNYLYERFVGVQSFTETLTYLVRKRHVRILYIASHGSQDALSCPDKTTISTSTLADLLIEANKTTTLDGILFGSCLFGNHQTALKLLEASQVSAPTRVKWVAGYTKSVSWFDSTLLDSYFLYHLLTAENERSIGDKEVTLTALDAVERSCRRVGSEMLQLASRLNFQVYARKRGRKPGVRTLIPEQQL